MRKFSNFIIEELQKEAIAVFIVIELGLSTPQRWTTLPYDTVIDGSLHIGKAKLVTFDLPRADQAIGRDSYKITVADNDRFVETLLIGSGMSAPMRIRMGFLNEYTAQVNDLVEVYNGSIDTWVFQQSGESRSLTIQGVSPAGALSYNRSIYTDSNYVQQQNPLDRSMEAIGSTSAEEVVLGWGKAPS
jgi:hypothetical protein